MTPREERLAEFRKAAKDFVEFIPMAQFVYSTHISLRHKLVYVEVPKAGSSTIKGALIKTELGQPNFTFTSRRHIHLREYSPLLSPMQVGDFAKLFGSDKFFKFCFVRNPYERLLSGYLDKIARPSEQRALLCKQLGLSNPADHNLTFAEFVNAIAGQAPLEMDNHWRPQYYQTLQNKIAYDFIGRTESLRDDFLKIGEHLGADFTPYFRDEMGHAQGAASRLNEYMTPELAARIRDLYRLDFETFEYDPALPGC